jgi:hypothetical protein
MRFASSARWWGWCAKSDSEKYRKIIAEPLLDPYNNGYDATKYLNLLIVATEEALGIVAYPDVMRLLSEM